MSKIIENLWIKRLIIFLILMGIICLTAELDWAAEHPEVGYSVRIFWLVVILVAGIGLPIGFIHLAGNKEYQENQKDKLWFIIAIILFIIANGIPIFFYVILKMAPGFVLYLQLILMGLLPAFILQPKSLKLRYMIIVILFSLIILPIGFLINSAIDELWSGIPTMETNYYLFFWGLLMPFFYLILAIGWKFGGGSKRQSWNIFVAAMLYQTSTLEDFLYFLLNGAPLPGKWPWLENFVINLTTLFGHVATDQDLLLFCLIVSCIATIILFDIHGLIWEKFIKKIQK